MTGLQESVTVGVNQDGQGPLVINFVKNLSLEQTVHKNVEQTVSTLLVIM